MSQRERFQIDIWLRTGETFVDPIIWSHGNSHDTASRVLAGVMVFALSNLLSDCHLIQLSEKLLPSYNRVENLYETSTALSDFIASFPERGSHVLRLNTVCRAGISLLELNDGGAILSEKEVNTSLLISEGTVYFKACLCMGYLQSDIKQKRIKRYPDDATEEEKVATAVKEKNLIPVAQETILPSDCSFLNASCNLSEALSLYCRIHDCPF